MRERNVRSIIDESFAVLDIPDRRVKFFLRERRGCRHFSRGSRLDSFQSLGTTREKNKPARRFMDVPFVTTHFYFARNIDLHLLPVNFSHRLSKNSRAAPMTERIRKMFLFLR
jgi:hypothetical protein